MILLDIRNSAVLRSNLVFTLCSKTENLESQLVSQAIHALHELNAGHGTGKKIKKIKKRKKISVHLTRSQPG